MFAAINNSPILFALTNIIYPFDMRYFPIFRMVTPFLARVLTFSPGCRTISPRPTGAGDETADRGRQRDLKPTLDNALVVW